MLHGTLRQTARLRGRSYATEPAARCHAPRPLHGSARKVFATRSQTSGLRHDRPTSRQRRRQESTTGTLACRSALTPESTTSKPAHDTATSTAWGLSPALACSNREPGLLAVALADGQESRGFANRSAAEIDEVKQAKPTHRTFRQRFASDHSLGFSGLIGPSAERTPFTWVLRLKTLSPLQA